MYIHMKDAMLCNSGLEAEHTVYLRLAETQHTQRKTATAMIGSTARLLALAAFAAARVHATEAREAGGSISVPSSYSRSHIGYYAFDGNPETRWASKQGGKGCIEIDFGKTLEINRMEIVWEDAYAAEYKVEVAGEDRKWKTLAHKKDGRGGTDKFDDLRGNGRYFRICCLDFGPHALWSIWELTFGDPPVKAAVARAAQFISPDYKSRLIRGRLASHGVNEIVFAVRADGNDSHWYANFGYWAYDEDEPLYGKGGRLCKLDVKNEYKLPVKSVWVYPLCRNFRNKLIDEHA